jgi:hypothetical protein
LLDWVIRDIIATLKPIAQGSETRIEFSFTVFAFQASEVCSDALGSKGIVYKVV